MPEDMEIIIASGLSTVSAQTTLTLQELIVAMKASGMSDEAIRAVLMEDLAVGGRLFGTFKNQVKNTVKNGVGMASNNGSRGTFESAGVKEFQWISVGDNKVCPDCKGRHGELGAMDYFRNIGLPQSGFSICQQSCRCQLLPTGYKGENLDKPLIRNKI